MTDTVPEPVARMDRIGFEAAADGVGPGPYDLQCFDWRRPGTVVPGADVARFASGRLLEGSGREATSVPALPQGGKTTTVPTARS